MSSVLSMSRSHAQITQTSGGRWLTNGLRPTLRRDTITSPARRPTLPRWRFLPQVGT